MREPAFLRQNKDQWLEYEQQLFKNGADKSDPDRLAKLYLQLTDDLAYARTFYPRSKTQRYLNGLAARTHLLIYKNKKEKQNRLITFWSEELPLIYRQAHKYMLYSLLIFLASATLGYVSTLSDENFVRTILGDTYVNMTIQNIEAGKPTDVYAQEPSFDMFAFIAFNNVKVMLIMFAMGVAFSAGSIFQLFQNGVMVGAFLGFFKTYNVLSGAFPIIMVHGTLELSSLVITGAAGLMLGNSIMFPGTFTRGQAVQRAAKNGIKIMVGLIPVVLLAAFLEAYITRLAGMPLVLKLIIISISAVYMGWYYVVYPIIVTREDTYARELMKSGRKSLQPA